MKAANVHASRRSSSKVLAQQPNFPLRTKRLAGVASNFQVTKSFPMLHEAKIEPDLYRMLAYHTASYLCASLNATREEKIFDTGPNLLIDHREEFLKLANRTPNGLVVPKWENMIEFNQVCRAVVEIMKSNHLEKFVDTLLFPPMIRMVDGTWNEAAHQRPYASTKIHSDIWNGDQPGVLPIFMPILGDIARTTIAFWEPKEREMLPFLRFLPDYNEGSKLERSSSRYNIGLRLGHMYVADPLLLHKTIKNGGGLRVSLELRFIPKKKVRGDWLGSKHALPNWKKNFISLKEFYRNVTEKLIVVEETFADTIARYSKANSKKKSKPIDYSEYFKPVSFRK